MIAARFGTILNAALAVRELVRDRRLAGVGHALLAALCWGAVS